MLIVNHIFIATPTVTRILKYSSKTCESSTWRWTL